jgi:UDP-N-acetylmuramoyl-tripeptide--D-alanyl-D-alanine ligase
MMNYHNWAACGAGHWLNGKLPSTVDRICNDTRKLSKNSCFIAIETERTDGHDFVAQAEQAGASCAIVDHPMGNVTIPQFICTDTLECLNRIASWTRENFSGKIVAIGGSIGKTSTKDILSLLLNIKNNKTFLTENGQLGVPLTLAKLVNDEPIGVIELGVDCIGGMDRLLKLAQPTDCIVTENARIHLNNFGNEDAIALEKVKLAEYALGRSGGCILSSELLKFECFRRIAEFCTVPGTNTGDRVHFSVKYVGNTREVNLRIGGEEYAFRVPNLMSTGIVKNLVLALTYALLAGVNCGDIRARLREWQPSPMRGTLEEINGRTFFADCYNANPTAFLDSLSHFDRLFPSGNRLFVVGSLSDRELGKYSAEENIRLGQNIPARGSDVVLAIGEHADKVKVGLLKASVPIENIHCLEDTERARKFIGTHGGPVYLKGHGIYHLEKLIG